MSHIRSSHLFTSESVSMGHPDKVADQISDAVLDSLLAVDPYARVACETLVTTGLVVLAGEITVHNQKAIDALNNAENTARKTIQQIGYDDPTTGFDFRSCAVLRALHSQSADISRGSFSKTVTLNPRLASSIAVVRPPGPAPTTMICFFESFCVVI